MRCAACETRGTRNPDDCFRLAWTCRVFLPQNQINSKWSIGQLDTGWDAEIQVIFELKITFGLKFGILKGKFPQRQ